MPTATLVPPTENSHHRHGLQEEENAPVPDSPVRQRTTAEDTDATLGIQPRPRRPHDPNTTTSSSSSSFPSSPILLSAHQQSELARFLGEHGIAMGTLLASLNEGGEGGDSPTPAITSTGNTTTTTTTPCDEIRILDVEMSQGHQGLLRILSELTIPFELSQPPPIRMPTIGDDDNILLGDDIMENTGGGGGGGEEENEEHHFISNNRFSREDYIDDDDQLSGLIAQLDAAAAAAPQTNAALQKEDSMQRLIKAIRCMEKQPTSMTPSEADRLTGVLEEQYAAFDQTKAFSSSSYSSLALAPSSLR